MLHADVTVDRRDFAVRATLRVADGERVALFGPSGAGKTTVLEAIAGLVPLRAGRVEVAGRLLAACGPPEVALPPWRRRAGLLRQDPGLFPHLTVRANLLYARSARSARSAWSARPAPPRELDSIARELGIDGLLGEMPARLSGGQRHRVALGRLLLARCDVLLLDEPFASLDAALRRSLTALVASLAADRAIPSVLVTHQLADAQAFADRLAVIDRGRVLQEGAPSEVVLRPASRRAAELVGYLGFVPVPGTRAAHGEAPATEGPDREAPVAGDGAGPVVAGVHPDRVIAGDHPERGLVMTATVTAIRPSGVGWEADLLTGGAALTCRLPDRPPAGPLALTVIDPPLFGPDGNALDGG